MNTRILSPRELIAVTAAWWAEHALVLEQNRCDLHAAGLPDTLEYPHRLALHRAQLARAEWVTLKENTNHE